MTPALAIPTKKQLDGGTWEVRTRCPDCQVEVVLASEVEPGELAMKYAKLTRCESCGDKIEQARERHEIERVQNRMHRRIAASGLPTALQGMTFEQLVRSDDRRGQAIDACEKWAETGGGILLYGDVGRGKTRAAATACWSRLQHGPCTWVSVAVLIAQLGAAWNDDARREAIATITGEHALILDDFDKVKPSEWVVSQLFAAVDRRIQAGAPLLVTTNLRPSQLGENFGAPLMSRLAALKQFEWTGPDMRLSMGLDTYDEED
jgi:DNA replication protein DnaC